MPTKEEYAKWTLRQKQRNLDGKRRRRLVKPSYNGHLRRCFERRDEYYELYKELFEKQEGVCAICQKPPTVLKLFMDHNHKTLEVRGLLCVGCNTKLGFVERYPRRILKYLKGELYD